MAGSGVELDAGAICRDTGGRSSVKVDPGRISFGHSVDIVAV
jgi:hypothetical protein